MIGAMPLLVVDVELTTIEARLSQKHLREDFENIHSTFLYKSPMIEPGMGPLPRHVLATDWEFSLNLETVVFPFKLSAHAKRSLVMGTVPFSIFPSYRVTLAVSASFGAHITGVL